MHVDDSRLSQVTTIWSVIFEACHGPERADRRAQAEVLERYCGAIYRYAVRVLGDPDLAEEACQEFAYRFVRGNFRHAHPAKGRFRDYVKTAVIHLLGEFRRQRQSQRKAVRLEGQLAVAPLTPPPIEAEETEFLLLWRKELLNRAWREMEQQQSASGAPYYAALRFKADSPELSTAELAERLNAAGHGDYTAAGVRQVLHRAREVFAEKLLDEVSRSILSSDPDALADELAELDLLTYCQAALKRRRG
jgi:RNA polymerase sigma-70 factor (ECF subfamily)